MRYNAFFALYLLGGMCFLPTTSMADSTDCKTTVDCAKVMVAEAAEAKVAVADLSAKLAATQAQLAKQNDALVATQANLAALAKNFGSNFKNESDKGNCTYAPVWGEDRGKLPPGSPTGDFHSAAWCPLHSYVAGLVNWKGEAQAAGAICCPG